MLFTFIWRINISTSFIKSINAIQSIKFKNVLFSAQDEFSLMYIHGKRLPIVELENCFFVADSKTFHKIKDAAPSWSEELVRLIAQFSGREELEFNNRSFVTFSHQSLVNLSEDYFFWDLTAKGKVFRNLTKTAPQRKLKFFVVSFFPFLSFLFTSASITCSYPDFFR